MRDLNLEVEGRTLHAYDTETKGSLPIFWFHGTPNLGDPPVPLFPAAAELDMRWIGYDRPGYGGSAPDPGRDIASAAKDVTVIADALGLDRFAVMGFSGGASHALGCAALLPKRVVGVIAVSALAPPESENLDWFGGMINSGVASLRAAAHGREAKMQFESSGTEYDPEFTPADLEALRGEWSWLSHVAEAGMKSGPWGLIDDDIAYVSRWGCDPAQIAVPVLLIHGGADGIAPSAHGKWLADHIARSELWLSPDDGHVSALRSAPEAMRRLRAQVSAA